MILLAVVLFAALNYAVTNSTRGEGKNASGEIATLTAADLQQYASLIENTVLRLTTTGGCTTAQISYETPSGVNVNSNAPSDKRCHVFHVSGGGVTYRADMALGTGCNLSTLSVGQNCNGILYAGSNGGTRLYTTASDMGPASWNNGSGTWTVTGFTSTTDGLTNTNGLIALSDAGAPYVAANLCRTLGTKWYLPAQNEMDVLFGNRIVGAFSGTYAATYYWTSTEAASNRAQRKDFTDGSYYSNGKSAAYAIRCVRRD